MSDSRPFLTGFAPAALRERFARDGLQPYRADQIVQWLYARGVDDPRLMTDLPLALRERLLAEWRVHALEVDAVEYSRDGTSKARLRTADGEVIETVAIPEGERTTLCVSTQVGCSLACSFCATATLGFTRNLRVEEITDQVLRMSALLSPGRKITNVVFMGMGEPLLNFDAVVEAVEVLLHPKGLALAPRRVTVSTAGVVPRIAPLLERVPVNLAVSLHATTDAVRDQLVPLNRRFPLDALLGTLRELRQPTQRRPVFIEYTLIADVNDAPEDARRLARILRGIPTKVNLIPVSPYPGADRVPPADPVIDRFLAELARTGETVTLRRSRGADIDAACGQLAGV